MNINKAQTIVIKIGSSLLADKNRNLRKKWITSALGQPMLLGEYRRAFAEHKYKCAQILITISDIENRRRYLNAQNTIEKLMEYGIIPIVNENDTVATNELRFGDNDRISALIAQMVHADLLVILSDIEGLYTDDPNKNPDAEFIPVVRDIDSVRENAKGASSSVGSGGMITKIVAAEIADSAGCSTIISKGSMQNPLKRLVDGAKHTLFESTDDPIGARKKWILNSPISRGVITVDKGCEAALIKKKSLLAVGIEGTKGKYNRGDVVVIKNTEGEDIARGITAFSSIDVKKIKGRQSSEIEKLLGFSGRDAVVHVNDMVLL